MLKSMEFRGKTTDDAVARALSELGVERDDISVEIIERGKTGFLGIGAVEAVVRVSYEGPDEEPVPVPEEPAAPKAAELRPEPEQKDAPKAEPVKQLRSRGERSDKRLG